MTKTEAMLKLVVLFQHSGTLEALPTVSSDGEDLLDD